MQMNMVSDYAYWSLELSRQSFQPSGETTEDMYVLENTTVA